MFRYVSLQPSSKCSSSRHGARAARTASTHCTRNTGEYSHRASLRTTLQTPTVATRSTVRQTSASVLPSAASTSSLQTCTRARCFLNASIYKSALRRNIFMRALWLRCRCDHITSDSIQVHDGENSRAPILTTICNKHSSIVQVRQRQLNVYKMGIRMWKYDFLYFRLSLPAAFSTLSSSQTDVTSFRDLLQIIPSTCQADGKVRKIYLRRERE